MQSHTRARTHTHTTHTHAHARTHTHARTLRETQSLGYSPHVINSVTCAFYKNETYCAVGLSRPGSCLPRCLVSQQARQTQFSISQQQEANDLAKDGNKLTEQAVSQGHVAIAQGEKALLYNRLLAAIEQHMHRHDGRLLDEKVKQFETLANLSALIGGFQMVVLVESQLPDALAVTNENLMVLFAATSCIGVGMMLTCMLISSKALFRLLHFRSHYNPPHKDVNPKDHFYCIHGDNVPFDLSQWKNRFQPAWEKAFNWFQLGASRVCTFIAILRESCADARPPTHVT